MLDATQFLASAERRTLHVGIIGLGYVGLPLALAFAERGFQVTGYDLDGHKIDAITRGESYIRHIPSERLRAVIDRFHVTDSEQDLGTCHALIMCVPTPLSATRDPDISYVLAAAQTAARLIKQGTLKLVVLESTTYPGTTDTELRRALEDGSGYKAGLDFWLAFSPEREDPGNKAYDNTTIPKLVGGLTQGSTVAASALYASVIERVVPVSGPRVAEMSKLLENTFRCVNIALVNELKVICEGMGIDVWEVIEAASTKPFGFTRFDPGPGLGGHCIPVDPFYLSWKARAYGLITRFIELAGQINHEMPGRVVQRVADVLNGQLGLAVNGAHVLVLGAAYKRDVDDVRESPALEIIAQLWDRGAVVTYHDPYVPTIQFITDRTHNGQSEMESINLTDDALALSDVVVIVTDHTAIDYARVTRCANLVVDTRNATKGCPNQKRVVKA